jgi:dihydropteroate synthase
LGTRTVIIGVLEVPPKAAGESVDRETLLRRAREMQECGADLIDVTCQPPEMTAERVTADEELASFVPVLRKLRHNLDVPVCVTTYNAETAERALDLGASVINDRSGLGFDPQVAAVVNRHGAGLILAHCRGTPDTWRRLQPVLNLTESVVRDLRSSVARARQAGMDPRQIVVDPGLGLGKKGLDNYRVLGQLEQLCDLNVPIAISASRLPFLTESVRASESEWLAADAAAAVIAICAGAHLLRSYGVAQVVQAAKVADRLFEAWVSQRN